MSLSRLVIALISFLMVFSALSRDTYARIVYSFEVETRILQFDPQAGMKSTHTVTLDFNENTEKLTISGQYRTGTTDFFGVSLPSVRNSFKISKFSYDLSGNGFVKFSLTGETGSGVGVVPNINYSFDIEARPVPQGLSWKISGCHDGYPAYSVKMKNNDTGKRKVLYQFKHKSMNLLKLFGTCDVKVGQTVVMED